MGLTASTVILSHRDGYKICTVGILPVQKLANPIIPTAWIYTTVPDNTTCALQNQGSIHIVPLAPMAGIDENQ